MKLIIKKNQTSDLIFYLAYGIYLVLGILSTSFYFKYYFGTPYRIMLGGVLVLLIFREIYNNKFTRKSLYSFVICAMMFFIVNYFGSALLAIMFVMIWCARNMEFKQIAKFTLVISLVTFIFIVSSALLGVIENYYNHNPLRSRYYIGFRYALYGPAVYYNILSLFIYIRKDKLRWIEVISLFTVNLWIFKQTDARLSFCLGTILLIVGIVMKYFKNILKKRKIICACMVCSFWICAIGSIGLTVFYNSSISWMSKWNTFFGRRLSLGQSTLLSYGVSLFGQKVSLIGWGRDIDGNVNTNVYTNYNYVDCAYLNVMLRYGFVLLLVCLIALTAALIRCYHKKNYYLLVLLTFVALHAMIDDLIIYLFYNTLWFVSVTRIDGPGYSGTTV